MTALPNEPQNDFDRLRLRVEELAEACNEFFRSLPRLRDPSTGAEVVPTIQRRELADRVEGFLSQVAAEIKAAEAMRKADNEPHRVAVEAINSRYRPLTEKLDVIAKLIKPPLTRFLQAEQRRVEEEKKRAAAEAAERTRQAAEAALRAKANPTVENIVAAHAAEDAMTDAVERRDETQSSRAQVKSEFSPRARSLRTTRRAEVVDQDELYRFYRSHADVRDVLQRLANADLRRKDGPAAIPGCRVIEEESV